MGSEEIDRMRNYGKRWIPPKSAAGHFARLQDAKLIEEQREEKSRGVCKRCNMVKSKNGECMC